MHDPINPSHYRQGEIQTIDYILQIARLYPGDQAYLVGNILKYLSRSTLKNGREDIEKAHWYMCKLEEITDAD